VSGFGVEYEIHRAGYRVGEREPTAFAVVGYVVRRGRTATVLARGRGQDEPSFLVIIENTSRGLRIVDFRQSNRLPRVTPSERADIEEGALIHVHEELSDPAARRSLRRGAFPIGGGRTQGGFLNGFEAWV
jgi:hypothetical protein